MGRRQTCQSGGPHRPGLWSKAAIQLSALVAALVVALPSHSPTALAQDTEAAAGAASTPLRISTPIDVELNKLEKIDKGCRAYVVVNNPNEMPFKNVMLELYMFRTDGVIGRRFALDLGPLRPSKRAVKLFDLNAVSCEDIGSFLINDVVKCQSADTAVADCLPSLNLSSLTKVSLTK